MLGVLQDGCNKAGTETKLRQARLPNGPSSQKCPLLLLPEEIFSFGTKHFGIAIKILMKTHENPKLIVGHFWC